jgi:hypothetical protein
VPGKTERKVSKAAAFNLQSACVRDKPFVSIGGPECDANTLACSYDHASKIMVAVRHPGDNLAEPLLALSAVRIGKRCSASAPQLLPKSSSKGSRLFASTSSMWKLLVPGIPDRRHDSSTRAPQAKVTR